MVAIEEIEQKLLALSAATDARTRFGKVRLYVLLTEQICARPWEDVLTNVLAAAGERVCVQLREKFLADGELLRRARSDLPRFERRHLW